MKKIPMLAACGLIIMACGKLKVDSGNGDSNSGNKADAVFVAICELGSSTEPVVCEDFPATTDKTQASCQNDEKTRYAGMGVTAASYVGVNSAGATTSCSLNVNSSLRGSCKLSDRTIRYYQTAWSYVVATGDCAQRKGTWSDP